MNSAQQLGDIRSLNKDQIMDTSSNHRRFDSLRTKGLIKTALTNRPISIQALKKSLRINHSNLEDFVKYIKEPPNIFRTSNYHKTEQSDHQLLADVNGLKNIAKNMVAKSPTVKEIFSKRNSIKCKNLKKQLKIQRSDLKYDLSPYNEEKFLSYSLRKGKVNSGFENFKNKIAALQFKSIKLTNQNIKKRRRMELRNTFSVNNFSAEEGNKSSNSYNFWRKSSKSQSTHQRWKTQGDEKIGEKTLSEITEYCKRKNMKGINYLAIQLQLNVEDAKRISKKH